MRRRFLILSLSFLLWAIAWLGHDQPTVPACVLTTIDVGQGDALLIQTRDHQDILIDGGPGSNLMRELSRLLPAGDRDIELMVLTHPHADHVNGLVAVTQRLAVRQVWETGLNFQQAAHATWHQTLRDRGVDSVRVVAGQRAILGPAELTVLWPARDLSGSRLARDDAAAGGGVNDASIVLRLTCDGSSAMLMGDASSEIEERLLDGGSPVQAGLVKIGHHGSRFSSDQRFLQSVQAVWAVVSVGAGNRYGHPHPTTLLRLSQAGLRVLRTDQMGTIQLQTDGHGGWTRRGLTK